MAAMTVMPRTGEQWTVDDLDRLPDDGLQYELLDGLLLVTPAPSFLHQRVAGNLFVLLRQACPPGLEVFFAPADWRPDRGTSLQPDVLVIRDEDFRTQHVTAPPVLAVEVLSPATRRKDQLLKRSTYEELGVRSYWIVDPQEPSVLAVELEGGRYRTAARAAGGEPARVTLPFPVEIVPGDLLHRT
jgi:Uma2 family endonuclease